MAFVGLEAVSVSKLLLSPAAVLLLCPVLTAVGPIASQRVPLHLCGGCVPGRGSPLALLMGAGSQLPAVCPTETSPECPTVPSFPPLHFFFFLRCSQSDSIVNYYASCLLVEFPRTFLLTSAH